MQIRCELTEFQHIFSATIDPAHQRLKSCDQILGIQGLGYIIIGLSVQTGQLRVNLRLTRKDEKGVSSPFLGNSFKTIT